MKRLDPETPAIEPNEPVAMHQDAPGQPGYPLSSPTRAESDDSGDEADSPVCRSYD